jgi:23S rRNA (cytosine1962-C5)-methyltransferase
VDQALIGYQNLSKLGLDVLEDDGILVTCSCSGLVPEEDFRSAVVRAVRQKRRAARLLWSLGASPDHPVHPAMPETRYLKVLVWSVA